MSDHVTHWLNAYLDGELSANQLHRVDIHLAECEVCQRELESLEMLSDLLQEVPAPEFIPPERFASQVSLRLPHQRAQDSKKSMLEIGWWMIPLGLSAAWVFVSAFFFTNDLLSMGNSLGLLSSVSGWLAFGFPTEPYWSSTLGQFGLLSGNSLDLAASTEIFARTSLPQITMQVSIALLYLSWIAIWWARHTHRQQPDQAFAG
ncbi:MAG TPA: zf-HC2 domain-containing protein [Anaerolineales bacterium]